jgi:hypothetical protein
VERLETAKDLAVTLEFRLSSEVTKLIGTFQNVSQAVAFITSTVRTKQLLSLQEMDVPIGTGSGFLWDKKGHRDQLLCHCPAR